MGRHTRDRGHTREIELKITSKRDKGHTRERERERTNKRDRGHTRDRVEDYQQGSLVAAVPQSLCVCEGVCVQDQPCTRGDSTHISTSIRTRIGLCVYSCVRECVCV
jgi:hypothetical protein